MRRCRTPSRPIAPPMRSRENFKETQIRCPAERGKKRALPHLHISGGPLPPNVFPAEHPPFRGCVRGCMTVAPTDHPNSIPCSRGDGGLLGGRPGEARGENARGSGTEHWPREPPQPSSPHTSPCDTQPG
eukprot:6575003-Pyramimonas_sp.AAC.1